MTVFDAARETVRDAARVGLVAVRVAIVRVPPARETMLFVGVREITFGVVRVVVVRIALVRAPVSIVARPVVVVGVKR